MLVSNFSGGSTADAVNYVLSDTNWKKEERPHKSEVLSGDPSIVKEMGLLASKFANPTTSGVISFAKGETPTKEQMQEIIKDYKSQLFRGMEDRVALLFVLHKEKDKDHIHVIGANMDMQTGKYFNPFPPGDMTKDLLKAFSSLQNHKYGWQQVNQHPLKPSHTKTEHKANAHHKRSDFYAEVFKNAKDKRTFESACLDLAKSGEVKNRDELVSFLKDAGYQLSREGKDYISIVNPDGKNFRLKDGIFAKGADYKELIKEASQSVKSFNAQKVAQQLERIIERRTAFNEKRYNKPTTPEARQNASQAPSRAGSTATPASSPRAAPGAASPASQTRAEPTAQAQTPKADEKPASSADTGIAMGASAGATAIGGAQMQLSAAIAKRNSAKTPSEKAAAEQAVNQALAALARAQAQFEEEQARQPQSNNNKRKI
ncbi:relaxase/mobilization nuclease domain-containing protein [Burkholderia vietnamiensis]|uniref:relaxase/mobilization nuclease domain-containing protein n=1 Tax=Burkholderia vietnamiensis TaxID=60552 RepID=UPI00265268AD|nr:relaxase/mobilization nuclease domain-containing protein [Burkholderia vietnamiensis]MDN7815974.1 relaxase/mobilization nuclease domain-containing protein [Burkholderia vietnamiensis]